VLKVYHQGSDSYHSLVDFYDLLRAATTNGHLLSVFEFNEMTGSLHVNIANNEVSMFKDDWMVDGEGFSFKFRVFPIVLGSAVNGPGQTEIYNEFKLELVDSSIVEQCVDNVLTLKELTVLGNEQRDNQLEYEINPTGVTVFPMRMKALEVNKSIKSCATITVAEYWNTRDGKWEEIRDNEWVSTNFDENAMYVDFSSDQRWFISDLAPTFDWMYEETGILPDNVWIEVRFRTFDMSKPDYDNVYDFLVLKVVSNGELPSSFCNYDLLSIDPSTAMRGERHY
jgi:hypothetical protein